MTTKPIAATAITPEKIKTILLATDFSENARFALGHTGTVSLYLTNED